MKTKKILCITIYIIVGLLAIATVPASVFLVQIPNYMTILLCAAFVLSFIFCLKIAVKKRGGRIVLAISSLFVIVVSVLGNYCNPYWNSIYFKGKVSYYSQPADTVLTVEEAKEDLEYAMYYLDKLHPAFYGNVPLEVQERYDMVLAKLNETDRITVCELCQDIEYIFSVLRDGHSYVKLNVEEPHYMKDIYHFNEENCVLKAINGIELEALLKQTQDAYSYELESWQLRRLKDDLSTREGLQYIGFSVDEGVVYTYESENGEREDYTYYAEDFLLYDEYVECNRIEETQEDDAPFVYYEIDEEKSVAIFTLNSCKYNDEYRACLKEMFTEMKEKQIGNVAVDLRANGGGDSRVADEFIRYLDVDTWNSGEYEWRFGWFRIPFKNTIVKNDRYDDLTFDGEVYILTSANSFSSAMLFPQYVKDNHMGTLIGEAPGNTPNSYGDVAMFKLPNSQLFMQLSTKEFFRVDRNNPSNLVEPDIPCESDDAMDVLYETIAGR